LVCSEFLGLLYFLSAGWCDWDYFFLFPFFFVIRSVSGLCVSWFVVLFFCVDLCYLDCFFFFFLFICLLVLASGLYFFFLYCCSAGPEDSVQVWYAFTGALW